MIPALKAEEQLGMLHILQLGSGNVPAADFRAATGALKAAAGIREAAMKATPAMMRAMGVEVEEE